MVSEFPAGWLTATAVAIGGGKAEPEDLRTAARVLVALRREGALRRLHALPRTNDNDKEI